MLGVAVALFAGPITEGVELPAPLSVLAVVTVAIDIVLFAVSQAIALSAIPAHS